MKSFQTGGFPDAYHLGEAMDKWLREELQYGSTDVLVFGTNQHWKDVREAIPGATVSDEEGNALLGAYGHRVPVIVVERDLGGMYVIERELFEAILGHFE